MANWREIIISGSDAHLNSLNADTSLTASGITYPDADGTNDKVQREYKEQMVQMVHKVLMEP